MWEMHDGFGWWMVFGGFWMLFFWIAVVWLVAKAFTSGGGRQGRRGGSPAEITRERYARGEITREQYLQILTDLQGGSPASTG